MNKFDDDGDAEEEEDEYDEEDANLDYNADDYTSDSDENEDDLVEISDTDSVMSDEKRRQREMARYSNNPNILEMEINATKKDMEKLSKRIADVTGYDNWEKCRVTNIKSEVVDSIIDLYVEGSCYKLVQEYRQLKRNLGLQQDKLETLIKSKKRKTTETILFDREQRMLEIEDLREILRDKEMLGSSYRFHEYKKGVRKISVFNRWLIYRMKTSANEDRVSRSHNIYHDDPWNYLQRRLITKRERLADLYKSYFKSNEKEEYNIDMYVIREMIMELPEFDELNGSDGMNAKVLDMVRTLIYVKLFEDDISLKEGYIKDRSSIGLIDKEEREEIPEDIGMNDYSYIFGSSDDEFPVDTNKAEEEFLRAYDGNDGEIIEKQRKSQIRYIWGQIKEGERDESVSNVKEWKNKYYDAKYEYAHPNENKILDRRSTLYEYTVPDFPGEDPDYESPDEKEEKEEKFSDALTEVDEGEDVDMYDEFKIAVPSYEEYMAIVNEVQESVNEEIMALKVLKKEKEDMYRVPVEYETSPTSSPSNKRKSPRRKNRSPYTTPPKKTPKKKSPGEPPWKSPGKSPGKATPKSTPKKKSPRVIPTPGKPSTERENENVPRKKITVRTDILYSSSDSELSSSDGDNYRIAFRTDVRLLDNIDPTLDSLNHVSTEDVKWLDNLLFDMDTENTTTLKALRGATWMVMKLSNRLEEVYGMLMKLNGENEIICPVLKISKEYIDELEKEFIGGMELCTEIELQNESLYTATKIAVPMVKDFLDGLNTCCSLLMILDEMDNDMYTVCLNSRMIFNENARFVKVNRDLAKRNIHLERRQGLFEETKKKYEDMKVIETRYIEMAKLHKQREENENAIKIEKADERDEELMSRAMRKENNAILKAWKDLRKSEVEFFVKKKKEEMEAKEKPDTKKDHMPFVFAPVSAPSVSQEITRSDMWNAHVSEFSRDFITRLEHPFKELNDIINEHYAKVRRSFHAIQTVVEDIKIIRLPVMDTRCLDPPRVLLDNADFSCYNGDHRRVNFGRKGCYTILCCTNHLEELENRRGIVLLDKHYSYSDKYWNLVFETDG